ncbi:hypothetical protein ICL81_03990 [Leucobacter sp. cx-328]|uniref:hypothetical protein n=1 Tax=unclassified Leucobacter TaxID=2621730 RepID=UPI00165E3D12|nr:MULTISPECIES: hypothetical protein [unclassified Leucobacter]MBC9943689.1 hypothetical protein [Leucobacter sp. cx-328]
MSDNSKKFEVAPSISVLLTSLGTSAILGILIWVYLPLLRWQSWSQVQLVLVTESVGNTLQKAGWGLLAGSIALLAAGLVVLTISGLSQNTAAGILRRRTVDNTVATFINAAVVLITVPVWGLVASLAIIASAGIDQLDRTRPVLKRAEEIDLFNWAIENFILGFCGLLILVCATSLLKAAKVWMTSDEDLVGDRIEKLASRIIQIDFARVLALQGASKSENPLVKSVALFLGRLLFILVTNYVVLGLFAANWSWPEPARDAATVTPWEWALRLTLMVTVPSLLTGIAAIAPISVFRWTSTRKIVEGKQAASVGYRVTKFSLWALGFVGVLILPTLLSLAIFPLGEEVKLGHAIGFAMCMFAVALVCIPFGPGKLDRVIAAVAAGEHARSLRFYLKELDGMPSNQGHDREEPSYVLSLRI